MITREKMIHHIESLREKHDELDYKIKESYEHRLNDIQLEELKKKKLKIKDDIELSLNKLKKLN